MGVLPRFGFLCLLIVAVAGRRINQTHTKAVETICYGDLGCFTTADPWTSSVRPLSALPEDPSVINTRFLLNTRSNPDPANPIALVRDDALGLYASPFDSTKRTVLLIHGWTNDANHNWMTSAVREILINDDVNIFRVDWAPGAGLPLLRALTNTQVVGAEMSAFILFLTSKTVFDLKDIHLIGHDLGAHAASYTGRRLYGIGRITGLDPSTIYFEGADSAVRLDPTDALLVDIVHTDAPYQHSGVFGSDHIGLGFTSSLGHIDIFVNDGLAQPGCDDTISKLVNSADKLVTYTGLSGPIDPYVCSHMRSVNYFVEAINSACPFSAFLCSSFSSFQKGNCYSTCGLSAAKCTALGYNAGKYPARGDFYMDTQSSAPYCNEVVRMEIDVSPSQLDTKGEVNYILIGDVGQTKEQNFYSGLMVSGFISDLYVTLPGSNALRVGDINAVRLIYKKEAFQEKELIVQSVVVYQAKTTINAVAKYFQGAILPDGTYKTLNPVVDAQF